MKFRKIFIRNIASLENATIDFTVSPLADARLFLITGPTGAGKSSILDAIALALYGTAPRLAVARTRQLTDSTRGSQPDEIQEVLVQFNDPANLIRKGVTEAWATLEFTGNDGRNYRAEFRASFYERKSPDHKKGDFKETFNLLFLLEEGKETRLTSKKKDFQAKIIEKGIVGMDFEQFCRTSMLAQGAFNAFLSAEPKEKSIILEKITGIDQFTAFGERIRMKALEAKHQWEELCRRLEGLIILDEENMKLKQTRLAWLQSTVLPVLQGRLRRIASLKHKIEEMLSAKESVEIKIAERDRIELINKSQQTNDDRRLVALFDNLTPYRTSLQTFRGNAELLRKSLDRLNRECQAGAGLQKQREEVEIKLTAARAESSETEEGLRQLAPFESLLNDSGRIGEWLREIANTQKEIARNEQEERNLSSQLTLDKAELERLKSDSADLEKENKADECRMQELNEDLEKHDRHKVRAELDSVNHALELCGSLSKGLAALADAGEKVGESRREVEKLSEEECKGAEQSVELEAHAEADELARLESVAQYEKVKVSLGDAVRALRHDLVVGEPCPVCNSIVSDIVPDEFFEAALRPLEENLAKLEQVAKESAAKAERGRVALQNIRAQIKAEQKQLSRLTADHAKMLGETAASIASSEIFDSRYAGSDYLSNHIAEFTEAVGLRQSEMQQRKQVLEGEWGKIEELRNLISQQSAKVIESAKNHQGALARCGRKTELISKSEGEISRIVAHIATLRERIETYVGNLTRVTWPEEVKENDPRREDERSEMVGMVDKLIETRRGLTERKNEAEKRMLLLSQIAEDLSLAITYREEVMNAVGSIIGTLPDRLREKWNPSVSAEMEPVAEPLALRNRLAELRGGVEADITAYLHAEAETVSQWKAFRIWLSSSDYFSENEEYLKADPSLGHTDVEVREISRGLEALEKQLVAVRAAEQGARDHLRKICEELPPVLLNQESAGRLDALESSVGVMLRQSQEEQTGLKIELDANARNLEEGRELQRRRQEAERLRKLLDIANNEFGGDRFKAIAASHILRHLLVKGNYYLERFSGRYEMAAVSGSLEVMVLDRETGLRRPFNTLSGGETFMVSLALALGLAAMQNVAVTTDTLFIDEGFGTLSADLLETIMETLERLQHLEGRRVGIISHVESLRERVETQITLRRDGPARSLLEIR